jgi:hypothetical protein
MTPILSSFKGQKKILYSPESDRRENGLVLQHNLKLLIDQNRLFLQSHRVPELYRSGVKYERTVIWDSIPALYARQVGGCESLTAARIAELRQRGIQVRPVFRWVKNDAGDDGYHILVLYENGSFEDPSKVLGIGCNR